MPIESKIENGGTEGSEFKPPPQNIFSLSTFWPVGSIVGIGSKRQLNEEDFFEQPDNTQVEQVFQRFLPLWIEEAKSGRRSIVRVLLKNCWKQWLVSFILTLVSQMLQLVVPTLIATITEYLTSSPRELGGTGGTIWEGLGYVAVVAGVCMVMSVCGGVGMILLQQMTLWFRHFLQMLIYQKALGMRSSDIKDQGKCLNLISTDANAFIHVFHMVNAVLTSPALLAASIYLLYHANGWVGLLTALIIALLFPITLYITQQVAKNTRIYQARSDTRIKLTNELIHGIRIIKYYVWEKPFMKRIDDARERELSTLVANGILKTLNMTVSMSTSSIALLVTFAIDGAVLGNEITPAKVFTSYSVISTIRQAFHQIGMFLNSYVMLSVAMGRIDSFITATDIGAAPEKMYTPVRSQLKGKDDDDEKSIDEADVENEDSIPLISRAQKEEEEEKEKEEEEGEMNGEDMVEFDGNDNDDVAVSLKDATYVWGDDAEAISHANMEVRKGELFMIIGSVGSGKSALIYSMLDELKCKSGSCTIRGSIAYVPQKPWILNCTLKDNIVFGCEYDDELYKKVLRTCALEDDLKILPGGDQCEIGERGITLSGGQKQRISMARAVYHGSDILFLDDPLSALDMNVGNYVLNECILGHLHDKTRILVTNNFHFLDCADRIAVMDAGRIAFVGTYAELKVSGIDLSKFIVKKKKKNNNKRNSDSDSDSDNDSEEDGCSSKAKGRKEKEGRNSDERKDPQSEAEAAAAGALTKKETRSKGLISFGLYVKYLKLGGMCFFVLIVIAYLNRLASRTLYSLALSSWSTSGSSNNSNTTATTDSSFSFSSTNTDYDDNGHAESMKYIWLQTGLLAYEMAMTFITFLLWCLDGRRASEKVHGMLIRALCGAPTRFFDTTPLGRLISRFSKDMNSVDQQLPNMIEVFMGTFVDLLVALIVICIANWWLACFIVAFAAVYLLLQRRYRRAAIELRRLEGTTRSPIYVHFDNTIAGLGCIRAYGCRDRFVADFATRMNANGRMQFSFFLFNRWFIQRLEWIGGAIQGLIVLSFTAAHYISTLDPGLVALALAKMSSITQALRGFSMSSTDVEQVMQAVERIMEFTDLPKEEKEDDDHFDGSADDGSVPPDWPATGSVTFKNFSLRYRDELPLVVKDLSCSVAGGEKIGVAGRTGSGKSTLLCSLFRIVEPAAGHIEIDGVDTRTLRLSTLRSKLSIIPQDPTLFSGSLRYNLDPFGEHTDDEIWNALDLAHLKSHVMGMENGLDSTVLENGENFSVGQRQLICMARAVLRKSRIIAMDEATASVDIKTDMQIQSMIRTEFSKCTVFTVAHRLHTIMDSDKVMVFDEGRLVEFDTPENLLTNYPDGHFLSMVKAANDETLWKLARKEITLEECLASGCATTSTEDDNNETD